MIRKALCAVVVLMCVFAGQRARADEALSFFTHMGDIPVMPGLVELSEDGYVFDNPGGRIGEGYAFGEQVSAEQIRSYYRGSLPQFGWVPAGDLEFQRDSERLTLLVDQGFDGQYLKIMIAPD